MHERDDRQAGLHVVDTRTEGPVTFHSIRQPFDCSSGPDGVVVAQEQRRLPVGRPGGSREQVVAPLGIRDDLDRAGQVGRKRFARSVLRTSMRLVAAG